MGIFSKKKKSSGEADSSSAQEEVDEKTEEIKTGGGNDKRRKIIIFACVAVMLALVVENEINGDLEEEPAPKKIAKKKSRKKMKKKLKKEVMEEPEESIDEPEETTDLAMVADKKPMAKIEPTVAPLKVDVGFSSDDEKPQMKDKMKDKMQDKMKNEMKHKMKDEMKPEMKDEMKDEMVSKEMMEDKSEYSSGDQNVDITDSFKQGSTELGLEKMNLEKEKMALEKMEIKEKPKEIVFVPPPDYEKLGRGLVYNCTNLHWACVDRTSYYQCRNNKKWNKKKDKKIQCSDFEVYASLNDCFLAQQDNVNKILNIDEFCK